MRKTKKINNKKTNWKIKRGRAAIWLLAGFFVLCGGCARKADVQLAGMSAETMYEAEGADADGGKTDARAMADSALAKASDSSKVRENTKMTGDMAADSGLPDESVLKEKDSPDGAEDSAAEQMAETEKLIYVHVCGAVQHPGVYPMAEGTRVYEAVALAGGFLPEADEQWLNQAAVIGDAQKLYVYSKEETRQMEAEPLRNSWTGGEEAAQNPGTAGDADVSLSDGGDLVDLNTASKEELMTLPGIGEAKAEAILQYRSEHGGFSCAEDLLQISGIKEGVFSRIKDRITVR